MTAAAGSACKSLICTTACLHVPHARVVPKLTSAHTTSCSAAQHSTARCMGSSLRYAQKQLCRLPLCAFRKLLPIYRAVLCWAGGSFNHSIGLSALAMRQGIIHRVEESARVHLPATHPQYL
jgi:hypothetical protein